MALITGQLGLVPEMISSQTVDTVYEGLIMGWVTWKIPWTEEPGGGGATVCGIA